MHQTRKRNKIGAGLVAGAGDLGHGARKAEKSCGQSKLGESWDGGCGLPWAHPEPIQLIKLVQERHAGSPGVHRRPKLEPSWEASTAMEPAETTSSGP